MIDQVQLQRFYDEHSRGLFSYLVTFTRNEADAGDLLQDVFVKLARNPNCLEGVENVKAFVFRMAHNVAIDWGRRVRSRRKRKEGFASESATFLAEAADPDTGRFRERLESAMAELPEDQRSAVYLKLWGGLSAEEIGEVSGVSGNTISSRYRYGIEKLRRVLQPIYDEIKE